MKMPDNSFESPRGNEEKFDPIDSWYKHIAQIGKGFANRKNDDLLDEDFEEVSALCLDVNIRMIKVSPIILGLGTQVKDIGLLKSRKPLLNLMKMVLRETAGCTRLI